MARTFPTSPRAEFASPTQVLFGMLYKLFVAALALTATFYASHDAREAMETLEEGGTLERARATPELVVAAAVYLACKLEESIVRLADVVNATTTALGNGAAKRGYDRVVVDDRANVRCDDESMRDRREGARLAGYGEEDGAEDDDGVVVVSGRVFEDDNVIGIERMLAVDAKLVVSILTAQNVYERRTRRAPSIEE